MPSISHHVSLQCKFTNRRATRGRTKSNDADIQSTPIPRTLDVSISDNVLDTWKLVTPIDRYACRCDALRIR